MADYIPCRRGERPFAPTIWYTMQHITPYILKTLLFLEYRGVYFVMSNELS